MKKYNEDYACWQSCSNCTYCEKGAYKFSEVQSNKPINKARRNWWCDGHESACADHVDNPIEECCEHWEMY